MFETHALRERVYLLVARIPAGRVATYGQLAELAGYPRRARFVGQALAALPRERELPWHRVINAQGRISPRGGESRRPGPSPERLQQRLLNGEGVRFRQGRVDLVRYRWQPVVDAAWAAEVLRGEAGAP